MRSYMVFLPPYGDEPTTDARNRADAENMVLVREGFYWLAALAPILWLAFNRVWLGLVFYVAIMACLVLALPALGFSFGQQAVVLAGINLVFGFEAHALRSDSLAKRGWRVIGLAVGRNKAEAERDFLRIYEPPRADNDLACFEGRFSS